MSEKRSEVRLNRFLAQCGIGSRRACDELIASGHVYCNGVRVAEMGLKIDPVNDRIEYRGKEVRRIAASEYYAYYKPREVMVTAVDPEGRTTIYDALAKGGRDMRHLRYVGRLDYQSEGLLLLTNDGDVIHALTHPRFHIKKVYHLKAERRLTDDEIKTLLGGVESRGVRLTAGAVRPISMDGDGRKQYWYEIDLYEGKNRQLRRMFESISVLVGRLRRVQFGPIKLGSLCPGMVRPLTPREISALKHTGFRIP